MKIRSKYISSPVLYCLAVALLLTVIYGAWRLALLLLIDDKGANVPASILAQSFLVGWRFDLLVTSFIMMPMTILAVIPGFDIAKSKLARSGHTILLVVLTSASFIAHVADIEFFGFFNVRLNATAMQWADTPGMMLSMIWESYPVTLYALLYGVAIALFWFGLRFLKRIFLSAPIKSPIWIHLAFVLLAAVLFFGGARGRISDKTVIRWGVAFFSKYDFANQLALNPTYTFLYDYVYSAGKKQGLEEFVTEIGRPDSEETVRTLLGAASPENSAAAERIYRPVRFDPPDADPPNVILIIMESYGATKIDVLDNIHDVELSPGFNSLADKATLFTNIYSEGMHTYSGVFSTLIGYPHLLTKQLMKGVRGQFYHHGLASILRDNGYSTDFYLTHDPHWDNMQGFLKSNGFEQVISSLDYDADQEVSTWGVPDHVMFDRVLEDLRVRPDGRFFKTIMTASNHGPWVIPDVPFERVPEGTPDAEILNAFKYSDWSLTRFVKEVLGDKSLTNTVIVIGSDNGAGGRRRSHPDLSQFHMPLLIIDSGDRIEKGLRVDDLGSQIDILATIMGVVRLNYINYSFGRDLFDTTSVGTRFAYLSEHYYLGYIEDGYYAIAPQRGRGHPQLYRLDNLGQNIADSLPKLTAEYRKKVESIFCGAYYNVLKPLTADHTR